MPMIKKPVKRYLLHFKYQRSAFRVDLLRFISGICLHLFNLISIFSFLFFLRAVAPRRRRRVKFNKAPAYSTYIYKVLKQVHPDTGISRMAMAIMNDYIYDLLRRIGAEARHLCEMTNKNTLDSREIQTSVRLTLPVNQMNYPLPFIIFGDLIFSSLLHPKKSRIEE